MVNVDVEIEDDWVICYPEYPNISCWIEQHSTLKVIFDNAMYSTSVLTVVLNLFIIISVSHFRQLHTPTNILLLSLAVSDCLTGLLLTPTLTLMMGNCWLLGDFGCTLFRFISNINLLASVGNIVLISVDRYVAICDPLHYKTRITVNRVKVCVCMLWFWSAAYHIYFFMAHFAQQIVYPTCLGACITLESAVAGKMQFVVSFILPVSVIIVLYMTVFVVAVSQARAMRSQITAVTKQISVTKRAKKSELKAARTLGLLVVVFLTCLLPIYFVSFEISSSEAVIYLTQYLHIFNSFLNPVIYALFYSWFRKTVKLIVTLQILRPGSCEANIL